MSAKPKALTCDEDLHGCSWPNTIYNSKTISFMTTLRPWNTPNDPLCDLNIPPTSCIANWAQWAHINTHIPVAPSLLYAVPSSQTQRPLFQWGPGSHKTLNTLPLLQQLLPLGRSVRVRIHQGRAGMVKGGGHHKCAWVVIWLLVKYTLVLHTCQAWKPEGVEDRLRGIMGCSILLATKQQMYACVLAYRSEICPDLNITHAACTCIV